MFRISAIIVATVAALLVLFWLILGVAPLMISAPNTVLAMGGVLLIVVAVLALAALLMWAAGAISKAP